MNTAETSVLPGAGEPPRDRFGLDPMAREHFESIIGRPEVVRALGAIMWLRQLYGIGYERLLYTIRGLEVPKEYEEAVAGALNMIAKDRVVPMTDLALDIELQELIIQGFAVHVPWLAPELKAVAVRKSELPVKPADGGYTQGND